MSRADYAHWNEEQDRVWWEEEGRHIEEPEYDTEDFHSYSAADAFAEDCAAEGMEQLVRWICDADWRTRHKEAVPILMAEIADRDMHGIA